MRGHGIAVAEQGKQCYAMAGLALIISGHRACSHDPHPKNVIHNKLSPISDWFSTPTLIAYAMLAEDPSMPPIPILFSNFKPLYAPTRVTTPTYGHRTLMDHYDPVHYVCQDHNSALQMPQRDKRLLPHTNALDYVGELCPMLNIDQCRKRRSPVAPCRASRSLSGGIYQCWKLGPRASRGLGGRSLLGDRQRNHRIRGSERRGYEHQRPEETRERQTRERIPVFAITPDNHAFSPTRFPNQFMFYNLTNFRIVASLA